MNKKRFLAPAFLAALLSAQSVHSATYVAVRNGDWVDPTTWDLGVPGFGDDKVVPSGITVRVMSQVDSAGLTQVFGTLDIRRFGFNVWDRLETQGSAGMVNVAFGGFLYLNPGASITNNRYLVCQYACRFAGSLTNNYVIQNFDELAIFGNVSAIVNNGVLLNDGTNFHVDSPTTFVNPGIFQNHAGAQAVITTLDNGGDVENQGVLIVNDAMSHGGPLTLFRNSASLYIAHLMTVSGGQFSNFGTTYLTAPYGGAGILVFEPGTALATNAPNSTIQFVDRSFMSNQSYFNNNGTINLVAGGWITNAGNWQNDGAIVSNSTFLNTGSFNNGGQVINNSSFTNSGHYTHNSGTFTNSGSVADSGMFDIWGGVIMNTGYVAVTGFLNDYESGSIVNNGTITKSCEASIYIEGSFSGNPVVDLCPTLEGLIALAQSMGVPINPLKQALDLLNDANPDNDVAVCNKISAFVSQVQVNKVLSDVQRTQLSNYARGARARIPACFGI